MRQAGNMLSLHRCYAPKIAFVDPVLTTSLPRHVVAATGMDALVHALEAFTSVRATPITDGLALQAIKMLKRSFASKLCTS